MAIQEPAKTPEPVSKVSKETLAYLKERYRDDDTVKRILKG